MKWFILLLLSLVLLMPVEGQNDSHVITSDNADELRELSTWQGDENGVHQLAFNPNAFQIVTINGDVGSIAFLDLGINEIIRELPESSAFAFSPNGAIFATINLDGVLTLYDTETFDIIDEISVENKREPIVNLLFSPNNQYIALGIGAPEVVANAKFVFVLYNLETKREIVKLERETDSITEIYATGIAFSDNSQAVFLSTSDGSIHQWDMISLEYQLIGENAEGWSRSLWRLYDDNLAYLTSDGFAVIEPDTNIEVLSVSVSHNPMIMMGAITTHPSQPLLVTSFLTLDTRETFLQIWNTEIAELVFVTVVGEARDFNVIDSVFSPDGRLLATSGSDGVVRLWGISNEE